MVNRIGRSVSRPSEVNTIRTEKSIPEWYQRFPAIYDIFLDCCKVSENPQLPTITVFAAGSSVRVCLCDRSKGRSIFRTGETPIDALEAIDEALTSQKPDWRKSRRTR